MFLELKYISKLIVLLPIKTELCKDFCDNCFQVALKDTYFSDNMTRGQLSAICRLLELTPIGTSSFLKLQVSIFSRVI